MRYKNRTAIGAAVEAAVHLQSGYADGPDKERSKNNPLRVCTFQSPENQKNKVPVNVNCCSQCSASTSVKRMMMFRDPVAHFRSQLAVYKSALTFDGRDTYLFEMVGTGYRLNNNRQKPGCIACMSDLQARKARRRPRRWLKIITLAWGCLIFRRFCHEYNAGFVWFVKLSTVKKTVCIFSIAVSTWYLVFLILSGSEVLDPWEFGPPDTEVVDKAIEPSPKHTLGNNSNAVPVDESEAIQELHKGFGKLFNNPQARFLLGFPYCLPGKVAPAAEDEVDGDPWVNFQNNVSDHQMRALIVAAVDDLYFAGITEEWDKSVLLLRHITGWDIQGYTKMLHNTDSGHPSAQKRAPLTDSNARSIRMLNRWDAFLFKVATARLHQRSGLITNMHATCQKPPQLNASTNPLKRIKVDCKFSATTEREAVPQCGTWCKGLNTSWTKRCALESCCGCAACSPGGIDCRRPRRACKQFDGLVSSQGGVGSSKFMQMLDKTGAHFNNFEDSDGFKHLDANHYTFDEVVTVSGPSGCAVAPRLLVIVGDVPHAVGSVYRRFGVGHINKLRNGAGWKPITKKTFDGFGTFNLTESAMPHYQDSWKGVAHSRLKVVDTKTLYRMNKTILHWLLSNK